ncbi:uncharacterized protein LOC121969679 isoform X2 [Zingiber officinale]|uniref:uncharacterized protein LOC121969679 isoform X2 n=1 Tax=Zingiber officinale TaxID=94328 RepID=UPI001C4DA0D5|nr:uncharacterized protein LOC121969679 isoform X2 [Zingiber officinale]
MGHADEGLVADPVAVVSTMENKSNGNKQRRLELEKEVADLQRMLCDEERVHEILERALVPQNALKTLHIPNFLPKKTKELLAELVMVEEEIARLEREISKVREGLQNVQGAQEQNFPKFHEHKHANGDVAKPPIKMLNAMPSLPNGKVLQDNIELETKSMFYINQAIKGDVLINGLSKKVGAGRITRSDQHNECQRMMEVKGRTPKNGGITEKVTMPKLPMKHLTIKNAEVEFLPKMYKQPSLGNSSDMNGVSYQPNKLSEKIVKCLICIFLRLLRTSRSMDIEKSGNLSKSSNLLLKSGSFQVDGNSISKGRTSFQREIRHHDPYGIFEFEDSLSRDIGPYKNLVKFSPCSSDYKEFSCSLSLMKKLRGLSRSLQDVDLRNLTDREKLAFWINAHNICMMHGFIEVGMPSNPEMVQGIENMAILDIGGNKLSALMIKHLLRWPSNSNEVCLILNLFKNYIVDSFICIISQERKGNRNDKEKLPEHYELGHSDLNVVFALCSGYKSSPAVKIYTADGVTSELEKSKLDYLQASIVVTTTKRIMIPHFLASSMHEFATDLDSLVHWIINQLPTSWPLRKSMLECLKGHTPGRISLAVDVIPSVSEIQYLLPM